MLHLGPALLTVLDVSAATVVDFGAAVRSVVDTVYEGAVVVSVVDLFCCVVDLVAAVRTVVDQVLYIAAVVLLLIR